MSIVTRQQQQKCAEGNFSQIVRQFQGKKPAIFLDYDGTLTPIVARPELALLSESMRCCLQELSQYYTVAIISGRQLKDIRRLVALDQLYYAGNHGLELLGPQDEQAARMVHEDFQGAVSAAYKVLSKSIGNIPGIIVEDKKFSLSVHYRCVDNKNIKIIERVIDSVLAKYTNLLKHFGKKVFEIRPAVSWDKGRIVLYLLDKLVLSNDKFVPIYIGDDVTDEDAFLALKKKGISLLVSELERDSYADYALRDTGEVQAFLRYLIDRGHCDD